MPFLCSAASSELRIKLVPETGIEPVRYCYRRI